MVRELKSHRRGPQITGIGPYDPNLAPKPPKKWLGWVGGVLALVALLGTGVWFGLMRNRLDAPPLDVDAIAPEAATGTVAAAETPEELVLPDLLFGMVAGLAAGEEAEAVAQYGSVRIVATAPDYAQEYFGKTAKRLRLDTNEWVAVANLPQTLSNQTCGLLEVALEADGFKADPASRRVLVQEGRTNDANFALMPLPATLTVTCNATGAVIQINEQPSTISNSIPVPSLQSLAVTVSAPGYRVQTLKLGPFDPLTTNQHPVTLEREAGALQIEATVPTNAQAYFQGQEKRIRLGTNDWKTVKTLPVLEENLACEALSVELVVAGFEVGKGVPTEPQVRDGQTTTVSFAISPLPATLKVTCNVTGAVIQINDQPSTVSNSLPVPSLQPLSVTVSATGYVAQVVKLGPMEPGKAYRQEVKLEPVSVAAVPTGEPGKPMTVDLGGGVKLELVWIPPGEFLMGSPGDEMGRSKNEGPQHRVKISRGFWMGKYEVTREQWDRVMGRKPTWFLMSHWSGKDYSKMTNHPIDSVNWADCQDFVGAINAELMDHTTGVVPRIRLPTEAEWEYACRAGTRKRFSSGDSESDVRESDQVWEGFGSDSHKQDHFSVGTKRPNAWGLFDMNGNVREWCEDWYAPSFYDLSPTVDPRGPETGAFHVVRGGGSHATLESCRSAYRCDQNPEYWGSGVNGLGFRVAASAPVNASATNSEGSSPSRQSEVAVVPQTVAGKPGEPMTVDLGGGVKMELVWVEALKMWVGKYEVTNAEYRRMKPDHDSQDFKGDSLNGDRQPVVYLNFDDAKAYAEWLNVQLRGRFPVAYKFRLPSEEEFMTYAQCGDGREYPWGNNWPPRSGQAGNYLGLEGADPLSQISGYYDGHPVTCDVDKSWANPWGLYGVGGNVEEFCASDSSGASFGACRGRSYFNCTQDALRCSSRNDYGGSIRLCTDRGFRVVLSQPSP